MNSLSDGVEPSAKGSGLFTTTHWSVVLAAGQSESPRAAEALETALPHLLVSPLRLCPAAWAWARGCPGPDAGLPAAIAGAQVVRPRRSRARDGFVRFCSPG